MRRKTLKHHSGQERQEVSSKIQLASSFTDFTNGRRVTITQAKLTWTEVEGAEGVRGVFRFLACSDTPYWPRHLYD